MKEFINCKKHIILKHKLVLLTLNHDIYHDSLDFMINLYSI